MSVGAISVFYPHALQEDPLRGRSLLQAGRYPLDPLGSDYVSDSPDWRRYEESSGYCKFNLHTLRFVVPLIRCAELGDRASLNTALRIISDWYASHPHRSAPKYHSCFRGDAALTGDVAGITCYAWGDEHAIAWRAIVIGYCEVVRQQHSGHLRDDFRSLRELAAVHASYLSKPSLYRHRHNHGATNALALIGLACAFPAVRRRRRWLTIGLRRAEQQMQDNVSSDGVHLEYSGFYHWYVLRSFLEIARASQSCNFTLSRSFMERLDRMVGVGAALSGTDGKVFGLPMSSPNESDWRCLGPAIDAILTGEFSPGRDFARQLWHGGVVERVHAFDEGGVICFLPRRADELEVVLQARTLESGTRSRNALGLAVAKQGRQLIWMPSTLFRPRSGDWGAYFRSETAYNTVQVSGIQQKPVDAKRSGLVFRLLRSYRVNTLAFKLGFADALSSLERVLGGGDEPLATALCRDPGEIMTGGSEEACLWYAVVRQYYCAGVGIRRTVALADGVILFVWDRLESRNVEHYTQRFHFAPEAELIIEAGQGRVMEEGETILSFVQADPGVTPGECRGRRNAREVCGWYGYASDQLPRPMPCLMYSARGRSAEFLWVAAPGEANLSVQWIHGRNKGDAVRQIRVDAFGTRGMLLHLEEDGSVARASSGDHRIKAARCHDMTTAEAGR